MSHRPILSVIMAVYNREAFLARTIDSILGQTFTDFEFIIVDDGSTDGSADLIRAYAQADKRIRPIFQHNQGTSRALNAGAVFAQGDFHARMDADDIALPTRFERQLRFLQQNPQIGVVGCLCPMIDDSDTPLPDVIFPGTGSIRLKWRMLFSTPIVHPAAMMRREALVAAGGYTPDILAQDYDLWLRMSPTVLLDNIPEPLLLYRAHAKSTTGARRSKQMLDAARSRQAHIEAVYGIAISLDESIALYTSVTESPQQAVEVTRLLTQIWHKFNQLNSSVPLSEYVKIYEEYLIKLFRIWLLRREPWRVVQYIGWRDVGLIGMVGPVIITRKALSIVQKWKNSLKLSRA